ncbi:PDZ domain-containing protein [Berryella wangjianweii]|uniref:PDZ domain-containing protein n=1 Tax=Berryella wangjianweii TaxID=2734634 RepID=A0A6M8IYB7_9ACTN|nr:S41 family peptidase [Berryella wangjianweii]NPD32539.1 PDZ domain-containing protein [Eggerthellaceae bacterium zg-997]QKF06710.1 PDZ domain-containing protein [Berryella wangjianweii]
MTQLKGPKRLVERTKRERARNVRLMQGLGFFLALAVMFGAGFAVRGNTSLLSSLGFPSSVTGTDVSPSVSGRVGGEFVGSLSARVGEVESVIKQYSLDSYDVDSATTAALDAFAEITKDPYLRYYTPDRFAALSSGDGARYSGVGVLFSEREGAAYVVDVFEGSSAQLEGVREGDVVVAIDGDRSQKWSRAEVTSALNREPGTTVVITWRRGETTSSSEQGTEFTTTLTCSDQTEANVSWLLEDEVGYIRVAQVNSTSTAMVQRAVQELIGEGAKSFVLDLRGNPGGYLNQAVGITSLFSNAGTVLRVRTSASELSKSTTEAQLTSAPLVVLVNGDTAASAEVIAAALQESGRATVVGERTLGKGSVQVTRPLSFGGALRYTAAYYLTAQGHPLDGAGVTPTVSVGNDGEGDRQLNFALDYAASASSRS